MAANPAKQNADDASSPLRVDRENNMACPSAQ
jgi:hypothetical protein